MHLRQISCGAQPIHLLSSEVQILCHFGFKNESSNSKQKTGKNIFAPFLINCFGAPGVPGQGCSSREAERANVVPYNRSWCGGAFKPDGRTVGLGGTIVRAASTAWLLNSFPPLETELLPPLVRSCQVQSPSDFSKRPLACCP